MAPTKRFWKKVSAIAIVFAIIGIAWIQEGRELTTAEERV